ncbi:beta-lactamase/transpeptidase-like protein [Teratosphaeria nubilosa]|uniref:Beta-lactamase/transpeptidase-like protein n=1 Tax=Teratosphaeria nubilosa TaxID=161662 RepID=A0A6G1LDC4_9PEZI|nr:beta-lactamase/transpeptidase-like protein [Teratosphaeria nubilosa]
MDLSPTTLLLESSNFPNASSAPITDHAVFLLASSTKLLATVAVLQGVDKGLYSLDDDVSPILPELGRSQILKGFTEDDKPILEDRQGPLTLRHLLTHASGVAYDGGDPLLISNWTNLLRFEPGTAWSYGASIDWAGKLLERAAGTTLEDWMRKHIWAPLGVKTITFWPERENLKDRIPTLVQKTSEGTFTEMNAPWDFINANSKDCFGGKGAYATMSDYLKVQRSILANDGRLPKPETVDQMFTPQLSEASVKALEHGIKASPMASLFIGEFRPDVSLNRGLGGILFVGTDVSSTPEGEDRARRKQGTLSWGGLTNPIWIIDRDAGVALTFGTQVMPPGDGKVKDVIGEVVKAVYAAAG